jgi:hypothetical protein
VVGAAIFIFVLIAAGLVLATPRGERRLVLGCMAIVGIAIWVAVRIRAHSVLGDFIGSLLAAAWEHRDEIVFGLAGAMVLIVPIAMAWMAVSDHLAQRAQSKKRKRIAGGRGSIHWYRRG